MVLDLDMQAGSEGHYYFRIGLIRVCGVGIVGRNNKGVRTAQKNKKKKKESKRIEGNQEWL